MIKAKFSIVDSFKTIGQNILKAAQQYVEQIVAQASSKIKESLVPIIDQALRNCPEIQSLQNGKLKADFGLPYDPTNEIINAIIGSIRVDNKKFILKRLVKSSTILVVYIQPSDFQNLLSEDFAKVITEKGRELPWLSWLLLEGDSVIITGYSIFYGDYSGLSYSRSGKAIMAESSRGVFKVDSSFSGTASDNFITRALEKYQIEIRDAIGKSL